MTETTKDTSTDKVEKPIPRLKEHILALADKFEQEIDVDKKSGVGSTKTDIYATNLPEGLNPEIVAKVDEYNADFIAASAYAFGKLSVAALKSNKTLTQTEIEVKMGETNTANMIVERSHTYPNNHGDPVERHADMSVKYTVNAGRNSGALKAARLLIQQLGSEKLK